jgi:hypothetical protein
VSPAGGDDDLLAGLEDDPEFSEMFGGLLAGELTGDPSLDLAPLLEEEEARGAAAAGAAAGAGAAGDGERSGLDAMGRALAGMMGARRHPSSLSGGLPGCMGAALQLLHPGGSSFDASRLALCRNKPRGGAGEEGLGAGRQPEAGSALLPSLDDMEGLLSSPAGTARQQRQRQQQQEQQQQQQQQRQRPGGRQGHGDDERGGTMQVWALGTGRRAPGTGARGFNRT